MARFLDRVNIAVNNRNVFEINGSITGVNALLMQDSVASLDFYSTCHIASQWRCGPNLNRQARRPRLRSEGAGCCQPLGGRVLGSINDLLCLLGS